MLARRRNWSVSCACGTWLYVMLFSFPVGVHAFDVDYEIGLRLEESLLLPGPFDEVAYWACVSGTCPLMWDLCAFSYSRVKAQCRELVETASDATSIEIDFDLSLRSATHEAITEEAFAQLIRRRSGEHNLGVFMDGQSIESIIRGVRNTDLMEMDALTAIYFDIEEELEAALEDHSVRLWLAALDPTLTSNATLELSAALLTSFAELHRDIDLGTSGSNPLSHAQFGQGVFAKDEEVWVQALRDYIRSSFWELYVLGLVAQRDRLFLRGGHIDLPPTSGHRNTFVAYSWVNQHGGFVNSRTGPRPVDEFVDAGLIRLQPARSVYETRAHHKILLGEVLHTIQDSFAHDIRVREDLGTMEIFGVLNDEWDGVDFGHDETVELTETCSFSSKEADSTPPRSRRCLSCWQDEHFCSEEGFDFLRTEHASTAAVTASYDFLELLSSALAYPGAPSMTDAFLGFYLDKWFSLTDRVTKRDENRDFDRYMDRLGRVSWYNFYNVDLWEKGPARDAGQRVAWVPWRQGVDNDEIRRLVIGDPSTRSRWEYDGHVFKPYERELYVFYSWDPNPWSRADFASKRLRLSRFHDRKGNPLERNVYTLKENAAAVYVPAHFRACFLYTAGANDRRRGVADAKFRDLDSYRCFFGGESGRLVAAGKEAPLRKGTRILLSDLSLILDQDRDGVWNDLDICWKDYNPDQGANDIEWGRCPETYPFRIAGPVYELPPWSLYLQAPFDFIGTQPLYRAP